jgi:hypothetical protein
MCCVVLYACHAMPGGRRKWMRWLIWEALGARTKCACKPLYGHLTSSLPNKGMLVLGIHTTIPHTKTEVKSLGRLCSLFQL